jgi:hypothetical protein
VNRRCRRHRAPQRGRCLRNGLMQTNALCKLGRQWAARCAGAQTRCGLQTYFEISLDTHRPVACAQFTWLSRLRPRCALARCLHESALVSCETRC